MNSRLDRLHLYPFERLNELLAGIDANTALPHIPLSLGEPRHAAPGFILDLVTNREIMQGGLATYPATRGSEDLRCAVARWLERRYRLDSGSIDPDSQVLPVNGTREALFAIAQATIDGDRRRCVVLPNPFYQIYEGAALLAGAEPVYVNCTQATRFLPDFERVPESTWARCDLLYINSPGNPCGRNIDRDTLIRLIELSDRYGFTIASDECYSEIFLDENAPPTGLLEVCREIGRSDFSNCVAFNSLSKRSNLPGLRSGFVAGDSHLIERFLLYRTYHGSAMPIQSQVVSAAAWNDEAHVIANRELYRRKFNAVLTTLGERLPLDTPEGGFYFWAAVGDSDTEFTRELYREQNVTVLPGSYLSREHDGVNPGAGRVRMALVASLDACLDAARRICDFVDDRQPGLQ